MTKRIGHPKVATTRTTRTKGAGAITTGVKTAKAHHLGAVGTTSAQAVVENTAIERKELIQAGMLGS